MYSELKDAVCREHHSNHRNSTRFDKIKSSVIDLCRLLILFRLQLTFNIIKNFNLDTIRDKLKRVCSTSFRS